MQTNRLTLFVIAGLIAASASPATASPDDALDFVKDAIVAADEHGGRCKRDVFEQLLEIRDLLRDDSEGRREGRGEERAAMKIERARRNTDRCPASVDRALRRASDELSDTRRSRRDRSPR